MITWIVDLAIFTIKAILQSRALIVALVIDLIIFITEAAMLKSSIGGSMRDGLDNYCNGRSSAEIEHQW